MRLVLFGTGKYYNMYYSFFSKHNIIALLDNDMDKVGTEKNNIPILCPADGVKLTFDKIFLLSESFLEMKEQLFCLGVSEDKICTIYDIHSVCGLSKKQVPLTIYCDPHRYRMLFQMKRPRIAIVTFGMGRNGGDFTVLLVAKALQHNYDVDIIASIDGVLRDDFLKLGMSVIIDENICVEHLEEAEWLFAYDLIFINGARHHTLFSKDSSKLQIPVIWWIHSCGKMNSDMMINRLEEERISQGNIEAYGVSDLVIKSFAELVPSWKLEKLCYGIEDAYSNEIYNNQKVIFALVGSFQSRKAQDVFLEAIQKLSEVKRIICEFWLIGPMDNSAFTKEVKEKAANIKEVKILGACDNKTLQGLYQKISVLVCPSLEDPMPIVCAEAMMHWHPCIVSDHTGTAQYIIPEENGLICRAGDTGDLAEKMEWMINHLDQLEIMGNEARKIYEKYFSFGQFEQKLSDVVKNALTTRFQ